MNKAIEKAVAKIAKEYGEHSIGLASNMRRVKPVPSGSLALDFAIGIGGLPDCRVVELAGDPGTGKSTAALVAMRSFLEHDERMGLYIDLERKMSEDWVAQILGDLTNRVVFVRPDSMEEATDIYDELIKTEGFSMAVVDSIGGAPTRGSLDKSALTQVFGGNAVAVGRFARRAAVLSDSYRVCTLGINQVREDMGGYNRIQTPGGKAWQHACVLRIHLKRGREKFHDKIGGEDVQVGFDVLARVHKNQVAAPGRVARYIFFNVPSSHGPVGVDTVEECVRLSQLVGVVERRGAFYYHAALPDGKVQGAVALLKAVQTDEALRLTLVSETLAALAAPDADLSAIAPVTDLDADFDASSVPSELER